MPPSLTHQQAVVHSPAETSILPLSPLLSPKLTDSQPKSGTIATTLQTTQLLAHIHALETSLHAHTQPAASSSTETPAAPSLRGPDATTHLRREWAHEEGVVVVEG